MDKKLFGLTILFLISFVLFAVYIFLNGSINNLTRAAADDLEPSVQKSLLFAWPLELPADGQSESEITIFIRNDDGKGIKELPVKISTTVGEVREGVLQTDEDGKATFHMTSTQAGVAEIQGFVNNRRLLRTISVQFD